MLYQKYKPLASRVYCTGLALLLVLSEVFSSNVQEVRRLPRQGKI